MNHVRRLQLMVHRTAWTLLTARLNRGLRPTKQCMMIVVARAAMENIEAAVSCLLSINIMHYFEDFPKG